MAATAASAIGSSISTPIHTLKTIRSKINGPSSDPFLIRIPSSTRLPSSLSHSYQPSIDPLPLAVLSYKWRVHKISAAVAQEETAVTAPEDEEEEQEQEQVGEEVSAGEEAGNTVNTKLYFGNLPYNVDSAQLAGMIQEYASPEMVEVVYDRESGRSRGFGFVTMSSIDDCSTVIENLDGRDLMGRSLKVNFSDKPKPREAFLFQETQHKLFVGNLSWSATNESLKEAFEEHGNVIGARVLYDGESGRSRGFGFICYETKEEMEAALEAMDGVEIDGRSIRVSIATGRRS